MSAVITACLEEPAAEYIYKGYFCSTWFHMVRGNKEVYRKLSVLVEGNMDATLLRTDIFKGNADVSSLGDEILRDWLDCPLISLHAAECKAMYHQGIAPQSPMLLLDALSSTFYLARCKITARIYGPFRQNGGR